MSPHIKARFNIAGYHWVLYLFMLLGPACTRVRYNKAVPFSYEIPKHVTIKEIKDRKLEWSDFTGEPDYKSDWESYIHVFFAYDTDSSYNYALPGEVYEDYVEPNLVMHYNICSDSWVKGSKATDELLNHQQTYWNIALMCGLEFEKKVRLQKPMERYNWRPKVLTMFLAMCENFDQLQKQYNEETKHGMNRRQQKYWDSKISFAIAKLKN